MGNSNAGVITWILYIRTPTNHLLWDIVLVTTQEAVGKWRARENPPLKADFVPLLVLSEFLPPDDCCWLLPVIREGSRGSAAPRRHDRSSLPVSVWRRRTEVFLQGTETKMKFPGEEKSTRRIQDHTGKSDVRGKNRKQINTKNTLPPKKAPEMGCDPFEEITVKLSNFVTYRNTNQGRTQKMTGEL